MHLDDYQEMHVEFGQCEICGISYHIQMPELTKPLIIERGKLELQREMVNMVLTKCPHCLTAVNVKALHNHTQFERWGCIPLVKV